MMSGSAERGTTASCTARSGAIRPIAPNAFLRPCQSRARSAGGRGAAHVAGAARAQDGGHGGGLRLHRVRAAVELDQQHRGGVGGIAGGVDGRLDRRDARPVHHLQRRGHDAGADDRGDRLARLRARSEKSASMVRTLAGIGSSRTAISVAMPNIPSLPTKRPDQVGPPRLALARAQPDHRRVGQHDLELDHVVGGDAVLEAVRPAGVLRHVAADGAGGLARRIGHVVEAVGRHGLGEPGVHHAGLEHGAAARPGPPRGCGSSG